MRIFRPELEEPHEVPRSWDNSGLRHRVEGREIEGVDVLALQSSVLEREGQRARTHRRLRSR